MRVGLGHMGIAPSAFWDYTLSEWVATIDGYRKKNGGGAEVEPLSKPELSKLMEMYPDDRNPS